LSGARAFVENLNVTLTPDPGNWVVSTHHIHTTPGTFRHKSATPKGDVWSFGVVMHEVLTRCKIYPYHDIVGNSKAIFSKVNAGHRIAGDLPRNAIAVCLAMLS
jgi:hypothetical protein